MVFFYRRNVFEKYKKIKANKRLLEKQKRQTNKEKKNHKRISKKLPFLNSLKRDKKTQAASKSSSTIWPLVLLGLR